MPYDPNSPIEDRLAALKTGSRSRQLVEPSNGDWCRMQLLVPQDVIRGMSEADVYGFLQGVGSDTLMKAYLAATSVTVARSVEGGISCSADSKGDFGCKGEISIRF